MTDTSQDNTTLISALQGGFDAALLFEGDTGKILFANSEAIDLFHSSTDVFYSSTMDEIMSFWSYSFQKEKTDEDYDNDSNNDLSDSEKGADEMDQLELIQVLDMASRASRPVDPILDWRITGKLQDIGHTEKKASSFPGMLRFNKLPVTSGGSGERAAQWIAYIRHADQHDIIMNNTSVNSKSGTVGTRVKRGALDNSKKPCITIGPDGIIKEISDPALALNRPARKGKGPAQPGWEWLTTEMIGKHISAAPLAQVKAQAAAGDTPGVPKATPFRMLDMILESGMEPGHPSQPMSGYPLKLDDGGISAMTTGGAQREENITEAAFEAALDPIFQIDEHGTIQMVNSAASKTFGWRRSEFLGKDINMICGGGHGAKHAGYLARYLATGDTRVIGKNRELMAQRKDGSEFPIELGVVEVDTFAGEVRLFCGFVRDLTSIKARERLAQEMVDLALDPMFQINGTGKILMVNQAALQTFGWERGELIGHNVSLICGGSHSFNHDLYLKKYLRTGETRVIGKYRELPAKRKDGSEFPIQLAVVEIETGSEKAEERMFCGFVHDLSRQKRDADIMRGTIDTSLDPVLHINENGIIQMVNNAACSHLGWTREELVGENVSLIVGAEHARNHGKYIERYLETGEKRAMGQKRALTARRKDGSEMPIELGLSEIKISGGKERMFCAFLTDLSNRQQGSPPQGAPPGSPQSTQPPSGSQGGCPMMNK